MGSGNHREYEAALTRAIYYVSKAALLNMVMKAEADTAKRRCGVQKVAQKGSSILFRSGEEWVMYDCAKDRILFKASVEGKPDLDTTLVEKCGYTRTGNSGKGVEASMAVQKATAKVGTISKDKLRIKVAEGKWEDLNNLSQEKVNELREQSGKRPWDLKEGTFADTPAGENAKKPEEPKKPEAEQPKEDKKPVEEKKPKAEKEPKKPEEPEKPSEQTSHGNEVKVGKCKGADVVGKDGQPLTKKRIEEIEKKVMAGKLKIPEKKKEGIHWGRADKNNRYAMMMAAAAGTEYRPVDNVDERGNLQPHEFKLNEDDYVRAIHMREYAKKKLAEIPHADYPQYYRIVSLPEGAVQKLLDGHETTMQMTGVTAVSFSEDFYSNRNMSNWFTRLNSGGNRLVKMVIERDEHLDSTVSMWHEDDRYTPTDPAYELVFGVPELEVTRAGMSEPKGIAETCRKKIKFLNKTVEVLTKKGDTKNPWLERAESDTARFGEYAALADALTEQGVDTRSRNAFESWVEKNRSKYPHLDLDEMSDMIIEPQPVVYCRARRERASA